MLDFPQYDRSPRGGADTWDDGLAGQILVADFFAQIAPTSGSAAGTLPLSGAASGNVGAAGITGAASGAIPLSGAAAARVAVAGAASGSLPLTGTAAGRIALAGGAAGVLDLSGSAVGAALVRAAGVGSLLLSGTAAGVVASAGAVAAALGLLPLAGVASGIVGAFTGSTRRTARLAQSRNGGRIFMVDENNEEQMTDTFFIKRGDTSPSLRFALEPVETVLTGATVTFQMRPRGGAMLVNRAASIITATGTPTVQFDWQAGDTDTEGQFEGEFRVAYADGAVETFPNAGFIPVRISEDVR